MEVSFGFCSQVACSSCITVKEGIREDLVGNEPLQLLLGDLGGGKASQETFLGEMDIAVWLCPLY